MMGPDAVRQTVIDAKKCSRCDRTDCLRVEAERAFEEFRQPIFAAAARFERVTPETWQTYVKASDHYIAARNKCEDVARGIDWQARALEAERRVKEEHDARVAAEADRDGWAEHAFCGGLPPWTLHANRHVRRFDGLPPASHATLLARILASISMDRASESVPS